MGKENKWQSLIEIPGLNIYQKGSNKNLIISDRCITYQTKDKIYKRPVDKIEDKKIIINGKIF